MPLMLAEREPISPVTTTPVLTSPRSARLQGFEKDLKLTGQQFPTIIAILYVGYGMADLDPPQVSGINVPT
jgi:hypothetical protein